MSDYDTKAEAALFDSAKNFSLGLIDMNLSAPWGSAEATIIEEDRGKIKDKFRELGVDLAEKEQITKTKESIESFAIKIFTAYLDEVFKLTHPDSEAFSDFINKDCNKSKEIKSVDKQKLFDQVSNMVVKDLFYKAIASRRPLKIYPAKIAPVIDFLEEYYGGEINYIEDSFTKIRKDMSPSALASLRQFLRENSLDASLEDIRDDSKLTTDELRHELGELFEDPPENN